MRISVKDTLFGSLVIAIVMETIDVVVLNVCSFGPNRGYGYRDVERSLLLFIPPLDEGYIFKESRRRVVFLMGSDGSNQESINNFECKIGRKLLSIAEEENMVPENATLYESQHVKHVLRNPVTLHGNDGGDGACEPAAKWQTRFYPTCNSFHELGMRFESNRKQKRQQGDIMKLLGVGTSRDAWKVKKHVRPEKYKNQAKLKMIEDGIILKTLQFSRDFSPLSYHFQILDAIASERLTSSPYVTDIYGFCGLSVLNEMGQQMDLEESQTRIERLRYARDLAAGLADAHDGRPYHGKRTKQEQNNASRKNAYNSSAMMVHADLRHSNVLLSVDGKKDLKLSDFNQGYFLGYDPKTKQQCGYKPNFTFWHDRFAAPEECLGDVQTEKTDVYHLGGMIFYILTGYKPYTFNFEAYQKREELWNKNYTWELPELPKRLDDAVHPANVIMKAGIKWCMKFKQSARPSAREVFEMLNRTYTNIQHWDE